ncbi:MAG: hypothetical protein LBM74_04525 [Oscillospiraceae bacterium]|jgi:hypothetical protein|nr:hypothetical protein [Oscillospiraceae bacterium]
MEAGQLWGYIVGGAGALIGVLGWLRTGRGDAAQQAGWMGKVDAKLDHISGELANLKGIHERLALVEASAKSAHKRIDAMSDRGKEGN